MNNENCRHETEDGACIRCGKPWDAESCAGFPTCDGDLVGEGHSKGCPKAQPSPVGDEALLKIMQNALTIHGMKYVLETVRAHDQSIQLGPLSPATVQDVQDAKDRRADIVRLEKEVERLNAENCEFERNFAKRESHWIAQNSQLQREVERLNGR